MGNTQTFFLLAQRLLGLPRHTSTPQKEGLRLGIGTQPTNMLNRDSFTHVGTVRVDRGEFVKA